MVSPTTRSNGAQLSRRAAKAMLLVVALALPLGAQARLLVPMDDAQQNHLKAYGLTYAALKAGMTAEWLLNYRGGAFLLPDGPELRRRAGLDGITFEPLDGGAVASIKAEIGRASCRERV